MEIRKGIHWVGVLDPGLKSLISLYPRSGVPHITPTLSRLMSQPWWISQGNFTEEFEKLEERIDLANLKHLIVNHTEPDHSGAEGSFGGHPPQGAWFQGGDPVLARGKHGLRRPCGGENDSLDWATAACGSSWRPSSTGLIPCYLFRGEGVLFICDAFGSHYSPPEGKLLESEQAEDFTEAIRYYFDSIMSPFKPKVQEAVAKVGSLDIDLIATGHGPILDRDPWRVVDLYRRWSCIEEGQAKKVIIAYASAYGHTKAMAELIAKGVEGAGNVEIALVDVGVAPESHLDELFEEFDALIIGSPQLTLT